MFFYSLYYSLRLEKLSHTTIRMTSNPFKLLATRQKYSHKRTKDMSPKIRKFTN